MKNTQKLNGILALTLAAAATGCGGSNYTKHDLDGDGLKDSISVTRSRSPQGAPMAQLETKVVFNKKVKVRRHGFLDSIWKYDTKVVPCEPLYFITPTQSRLDPSLDGRTPPTHNYFKADPREVEYEPTLRLQDGVDMPEIYLEVSGKGTDNKPIERKYIIHNVNFKALSTYAAKLQPSKDRHLIAYESGIPGKYIGNLIGRR